jgi:hypothetical protein
MAFTYMWFTGINTIINWPRRKIVTPILPPYGNQALGIDRFMLRRLMHDYLIKGHEQIMSALNASIIAQHSWVKQLNKQLG